MSIGGDGYIAHRQAQEIKNATICLELAALKRMFNLGAKHDPPKVLRVPYIPMPKVNNVRSGFFEYEEFVVLRTNLPDYLRPVVTMAYYSGWRKGEILGLTWDQVDLVRDCIRLDPGTTKNNESRSLFLDGELLVTIREQKVIRDCQYPDCPWVFFNEGRPIREIKRAWQTACKKAGVPDKLFHDFRRTTVRNMVRAGIPERVAMTISGHKTRSVFERYNIVSQEDLKQAASKLNQYVKKETFREPLEFDQIDQFIETLQS